MENNHERIFNRKYNKTRRVALRKNQTEPEKFFWQAVRGKQLGLKFRRQHGIGPYIVDFYCAEKKLVIELDGDSHYSSEAQALDAERDHYLRRLGLVVMRFTNLEVRNNLEEVLLRVLGDLASEPTAEPRQGPTPLLAEGVDPAACENVSRTQASSPCEGGGREGVFTRLKEELGYGA